MDTHYGFARYDKLSLGGDRPDGMAYAGIFDAAYIYRRLRQLDVDIHRRRKAAEADIPRQAVCRYVV